MSLEVEDNLESHMKDNILSDVDLPDQVENIDALIDILFKKQSDLYVVLDIVANRLTKIESDIKEIPWLREETIQNNQKIYILEQKVKALENFIKINFGNNKTEF